MKHSALSLMKRIALGLPVMLLCGGLLCLLLSHYPMTVFMAGIVVAKTIPIGPLAFAWPVALMLALLGSFYCVVRPSMGGRSLLVAGVLGLPFLTVDLGLIVVIMIMLTYGALLIIIDRSAPGPADPETTSPVQSPTKAGDTAP